MSKIFGGFDPGTPPPLNTALSRTYIVSSVAGYGSVPLTLTITLPLPITLT